jgi:hypothetical protein
LQTIWNKYAEILHTVGATLISNVAHWIQNKKWPSVFMIATSVSPRIQTDAFSWSARSSSNPFLFYLRLVISSTRLLR